MTRKEAHENLFVCFHGNNQSIKHNRKQNKTKQKNKPIKLASTKEANRSGQNSIKSVFRSGSLTKLMFFYSVSECGKKMLPTVELFFDTGK